MRNGIDTLLAAPSPAVLTRRRLRPPPNAAGCGGSNDCPGATTTHGQMVVSRSTTFELELYGT